jgi:Leucine-rich repeat (LRR) protein
MLKKLGLGSSSTVDLSKKKLPAMPDDLITSQKDAESLNLSENEISEIPNIIVKLKKLKKLNVSHNKLKQLPATLGELHRLACVTTLTVLLGSLPLVELSASHNAITSLPANFSCLTDLKILYLYLSLSLLSCRDILMQQKFA